VRTPKRQRGYLLITVVVTLFLLATIATLLAYDSANNARTTNSVLEATRADYIARAGLQNALWRTQDNACMGPVTIPATSLGDDSYEAWITGPGAGTAYTLAADQDAWIRSDDVTRNNGSTTWNHTRFENGNIEQVLTRFDLAQIPAQTQVRSAIAWFHIKSAKPHPEGAITVHAVSADWAENTITWQSFSDAYMSSAIATIPAQKDGDKWVKINITAQVQAWVNGQPNFGILFDSRAEGIHTEYTAREDGANPPRLEVVTGSDSAAQVDIQVNGTLGNGNQRVVTRVSEPAYQRPTTMSFPLGTAGKDGWVSASQSTDNYGASVEMTITGGASPEHFLAEFAIDELPAAGRVVAARLELYLNWMSSADPAAAFPLFAMAEDWKEGTGDNWNPHNGANWATSDGWSSWSWTTNHDPANPVVTTPVNPSYSGWHSWDITALAQQWSAGERPNNGLLIKGNNNVTDAWFRSSDWSDPEFHPRLVVDYACECSDACMTPRSSGNVLMVIGSWPYFPDPKEDAIRDVLEEWGYSVTLIQDDDSQGNFDAKLAANDVVFVSETVTSNNVGNKLTNASIGVVNADGRLNDELGIASSTGSPVTDAVDVVNTDHYITAIFPADTIRFKSHATELASATGTVALGAQVLGSSGGEALLVALEAGAASTNGGTVPARRVLLPVGEGDVSWDYLTNSGKLIVQRSIDWAMGGIASGGGLNVLLFVANGSNPSPRDSEKKEMIESFGMTVTLIDDDADDSKVKTELQTTDVVYVSGSVTASSILTRIADVSIPIVNEEVNLLADYGFSEGEGGSSTNSTLSADDSHYIYEPYGDGDVAAFSSNVEMGILGGLVSNDVIKVGGLAGANTAFAALEDGAVGWSGTAVHARRVHVPFGNADAREFTADGRALMKRTIEWAAGAGPKYGLIAHWKLDDGAGLVAADSVGGHDGTLDFGPTWSGGAIAGGVEFSDDYHAITAPYSNSLAITGDLTLSTWINADDLLPNKVLVHKGIDNETHNFYLGLHNNIIVFGMSPPGGGWNAVNTAATSIAENQWHHVAVTFDDSKDLVIFYLDGEKVSEATETLSPGDFGGPVRIGRNSNSYGWRGRLDDVRIYRDVLVADEIAALATRPPIAHWKLDENSGTTAVDSAGGHDGVVGSGSWESDGIVDGALRMPGNAHIRIPHDDALILNSQFTLMAWVTANQTSGYRTIINKGTSGNNQDYWFGTWYDWLTLGFYTGGGFQAVEVQLTDWTPSQPTHFAATFDNAENAVKLYKDGVLLKTETTSYEPRAGSEDLIIGRSQLLEFWNGMIDDVRIYDTVLGDAAIATIVSGGGGTGNAGGGDDDDDNSGGDKGVSYHAFSETKSPSNTTSLGIARPAGSVAGDLLIAAIALDGDSANSLSPPSGWTLVNAGNNANGSVGLGVFWKIAGNSEPAQYTFAWSGSEQAYGWIMRFSGHDAASPILYNNGALTGDRSSAPICQRLATPVDKMLVLRLGAFDDDDIDINIPGLAGHTPITMDESGTGNSSTSGGAGYITQETAGDSDLVRFQLTRAEEFRTVTLGIRPSQ